MPGDNCCIPRCGSCRRTKGMGMFKLPSIKKENLAEWRKLLLNEILKVRELDAKFKAQLEADKVHICEKHFHLHEWETFVGPKMTLKKLIPPALPTLNMTQKSHKTERTSRTYRSIVQDDPPDVKPDTRKHLFYNSLSEVIESLKTINNWTKNISEYELLLSKESTELKTHVPLYKVIIDDGLGFTIQIYDCFLPEDHTIYKKHKRSLTNVTVSELIKEIENFHVCPGIDLVEHNDANFIFHVIPLINDDDQYDGEDTPPPMNLFPNKNFIRHIKCQVLSTEKCYLCGTAGKELVKKRMLSNAPHEPHEPTKSKAPLSGTSKVRITAPLQVSRLKCKKRKKELAKLQYELQEKTYIKVELDF